MPTIHYSVKKGDTAATLLNTLKDGDNNGVEIPGDASVLFRSECLATGLNSAEVSATPDPDQTTNPGDLSASMEDVAADLDLGLHLCEWVVTYGDGTKRRWPTQGYELMNVWGDVAAPVAP